MHSNLTIFSGENSLLSTSIEEIRLFRNKDIDSLSIEIIITNFPKKSNFNKICLCFDDVIEFSFYHNEKYIFYNVESYKLYQLEEFFYLSLDPDSNDYPSENDQDFIKSRILTWKEI